MKRFAFLYTSRMLRIFYTVFFMLTILFMALNNYVDQQLAKRDYAGVFANCHKVWSARGIYSATEEQNSMSSFAQAFQQGAVGVEVDVFYDTGMDDFIVSHDYPYNKKDGKLLLLREVFAELGKGHYFWIDFKKLRKLSRDQAKAAAMRLHTIATATGVKKRIYVEGEHPTRLSLFRDSGFNTLFDTHPEPFGRFLAPVVINLFKMVYYFENYTVMAMEYGPVAHPVFSKASSRRLKYVPLFLYHVPVEEGVVDVLLLENSVRAFIVGDGQSVNFHNKNSCTD